VAVVAAEVALVRAGPAVVAVRPQTWPVVAGMKTGFAK